MVDQDERGFEFEGVMRGLSRGSIEKFRALPPEGRAYFLALAEPLLREKDHAALEALYAEDYERVPPDPATFLDSSDYIHHVAKDLFPNWRPYFIQACDPSYHVHEINITGASGIGKTTFAMFVLAYKIARILCLRDPAAFYGLQSKTKVYFGIYALTKKLVKQVGFYDLRDMIMDPSPFFRDVYPRLPHGGDYIKWATKRVEVLTGSSDLHAVGRTLFAVAADELNYFDQGDKTADDARKLVSELSTRLESRFIQHGGDIPGVAILISQTRTSTDFLERRIREKKGLPGVLNIRGPRWHFSTKGYDHADGFHPGDPTFRVFQGTEIADPKILDKVIRLEGSEVKVEPLNPDEHIPDGGVIDVPVVHHRAFVEDIHGALRNIGDVPSGATTPFFGRREVIEIAFAEELVFPFSGQTIPCYEKSPGTLQAAFDVEAMTCIHLGKRQPVRHPDAPRYLHIDLAQNAAMGTSDRAGLSMVHPSAHFRRDKKPEMDDVAQVGESEIVMEVEADFYLALTGGPYGEPIDFKKVRIFVDWLRKCGYWIRMVTCDQWQSFDMLQRLREAGFVAEVQSVDKTSRQYRDLRSCMNEGRFTMPFPPGALPPSKNNADPGWRRDAVSRVIVYQEFAGLEYDVKTDKVDHRDRNPDGTRGCFTLDTQVQLLDGTKPTFQELIDTYGRGGSSAVKTFRVWTVDHIEESLSIGGNILGGITSSGIGRRPRISRRNVPIVTVTLDNGGSLRCTPGHLFMLLDGRYCAAQSLKQGEILRVLTSDIPNAKAGGAKPSFAPGEGPDAMPLPFPYGPPNISNTFEPLPIVRVVSVTMAGSADVADIEVERTSNFAVVAGNLSVFVHNSKDIADSLAGSVFRCLTDKVAPGETASPTTSRQAIAEKLNRYLGHV